MGALKKAQKRNFSSISNINITIIINIIFVHSHHHHHHHELHPHPHNVAIVKRTYSSVARCMWKCKRTCSSVAWRMSGRTYSSVAWRMCGSASMMFVWIWMKSKRAYSNVASRTCVAVPMTLLYIPPHPTPPPMPKMTTVAGLSDVWHLKDVLESVLSILNTWPKTSKAPPGLQGGLSSPCSNHGATWFQDRHERYWKISKYIGSHSFSGCYMISFKINSRIPTQPGSQWEPIQAHLFKTATKAVEEPNGLRWRALSHAKQQLVQLVLVSTILI